MTSLRTPFLLRSFYFASIIIFIGQAVSHAQISGSPSLSICPGGNVVLSYTNPPAAPVTYQWVKDGGDIAGATGATYTATTPGSYNVKLNGNLMTAVTVGTATQPVADFSFSPTTGCGPTSIAFTNLSNDGGTPASSTGLTYLWDFGGGATSPALSPSYGFNPGVGSGTTGFPVKLVVTTTSGCKNEVTKTVSLKQLPDATLNGPGFVTFNGEPYFKICAATGQTFNFTNGSSTTGSNTRYVFSWGDGTADTDINMFSAVVSHPYSVGLKKLTYTVYAGTCSNSKAYNIFVGNVPAGGIAGTGGSTICTGDAQRFLITGAASNPIGTIYEINFKDGTPMRTFMHPAPDSVSHTFQISSCDSINSNGLATFRNAFGAYLTIRNPCGDAGGSILPIYVSSKPKPDFSVSRDSICIGQTIRFNNTGLAGKNVENQTCTPGKRVWTVTPLTPGGSWTLQLGSLGDRFGTNDPNLWNAGTDAITVLFNSPGRYRITQYAGNNTLCGLGDTSKVICVNPNPTAAFTLDKDNGCGPLTVNAAGTSNTAECGSMRFKWTVGYAATAGCTPNTSSFDYLNGTSETSQNPQIRFNNPGVYTLSLTTTAPGGACTSAPVTKTVTVRGKPAVAVNAFTEVCSNASVTPAAIVSCLGAGTAYAWSFPGGTPASSNSLTPGTVSFATPNSYAIALAVTNDCGTTTDTKTLLVKPVPDATVPASQTLCSGTATGALNFSSAPAGSSFRWTNDRTAIGLGASGNGNIPNFTAVNATGAPLVATISVAPTLNGCVGVAKTFTLTVNPRPGSPGVTSPVNLCQGVAAQPLTATGIAGHTLNWYTAATGGTGSISAPTPSTAATGTQRYYVSQTNTYACESPRSEIVVNVGPTPAITATSTNPTQCATATGSITLSGLTAGTSYVLTYTGSGTAVGPLNITANAQGNIVIGNLRSGVYDQIKVSLNGCASNILGPITLSDPSSPAAPVATNSGPLCSGATLTLSVTSPQGGVTYQWTGPSGFNQNGATVTRANAQTTATGTYSVTATLNGCTSPAGTTTVTVNPTPAAPTATTPVIYCQKQASVPLQATAAAGNELLWYDVSTGGTALGGAPTPNTDNAGTKTWYVSQRTAALCEGPRTAITVTVHPVPVITATSTNPTLCSASDGTITITGAGNNTNYTVQYERNGVVQTLSRTSDATGKLVIPSLTAGTYSSIRLVANNCPSNSVGPFELKDPTVPATPSIDQVSPLCSGNTLTLSVSSPLAGVIYRWTGPLNLNQTGNSVTIANAPATATGTYSVTATLNGCTSIAGTTVVTVNPTPLAPTVTSPVTYCKGAPTLALTATAVTGNRLLWYTTATGGTGTTTAPTPLSQTPGTFIWYVSQETTEKCEGPRAKIEVIVYPVYTITATSTNPSQCATANGSILISGAEPSTSFKVEYEKDGIAAVATLISDATGKITLANLMAGKYSRIRIVLNGCPSNELADIILSDPNPPATPDATNTGPVCVGGSITLNVNNALTGASYTWSGPAGFSSAGTSPTATLNPVTQASEGSYSVRVKKDNCTSAAGTTQVVVHPLPAAPTVTTPVVYCQNATATALEAVAAAGGSLRWYTASTGGTALASAPVPSTAATGTVSYYVSQVSAQGCEGPRGRIDVTVAATPTIGPQELSVCSGANFSFTPTGAIAGSIYTWGLPVMGAGLTGGAAGTGTAVTGRLNHDVLVAVKATYTVTPKLGNCIGTSFPLVVTVDPVARIADTSLVICSGDRLLFQPSTAVAGNFIPTGTIFQWPLPASNPTGSISGSSAGNGALSIDQTLQNLTSRTAILTYSLTPSLSPGARCPGKPFAVQVQVNPKPKIPDQQAVICSGSSFSVSIIDNPPTVIFPAGTLFTWTDPVSNPAGAVTGGSAVGTPQATIGQRLVNTTINTATVTYTVTPVATTSGGCAGEPFQVTVTVHPQPSIPDQKTETCSGTAFNLTPTGVPAGTRYTWTAPVSTPAGALTGGSAQGIGQPSISQVLENLTHEPAVMTYRVSPLSGNCGNVAFELAVTVFPRPVIPDLRDTICTGTAFQVTPRHQPPSSLLPAGTTYTWAAPIGLPAGIVTGGTAEGTPRTMVSQTLQNGSDVPAELVYTVVPKSGADGGCIGLPFRVTVLVRSDAKALFTPTDTIGCHPFPLTAAIVGLSSFPQRNGSLRWYANDSLLGTNIPFPVYTILNENDSVRLRLVALSLYGCKPDSIVKTFRTYVLPKPSFTMSDTAACGPLTVSFTNNTPNRGLFNYRWNFGNGEQSSQTEPGPVTYPVNPASTDTVYRVTLTVSTICTSVTFGRDLLVKSKPKSVFSPNRSVGCSPMTVSFNNSTRGRVDAYTWDFDDGTVLNTSRRDSVTHLFTTGTQRTFRVKLIARNECGADTSVFAIVVSPNQVKLDMAVNGPEKEGCAPHTVRFINLSSGANAFRWDFGDGNYFNTTKNLDTVIHTYPYPGVYMAKVTGTNGCSDTSTVEAITVRASPRALFDLSSIASCVGDSIRFTNRTDSAGSFVWDFGDGKTTVQVSPAHRYDQAGSYSIRLMAYRVYPSGLLCTDTFTRRVDVVGSLPVSYQIPDSIGVCLPFTARFRTPVTGAQLTTWDFGDGSTATGDSVAHTFTAQGEYTVRLRSVAPGGCVYLATGRVRVTAPSGTYSVDLRNSCKSQTVRIDVNAQGADSIIYDMGNGARFLRADPSFTYTYPNPGRYLPKVTLLTAAGCRRPLPNVDTIVVDRIVSGFTWSEARSCGRTELVLTDTSRAFTGIVASEWTAGPHQGLSGRTVRASFDASGDYLVQLRVRAQSGCLDSVVRTVSLRVNVRPTAGILSDTTGCTGKDVRFEPVVQSTDKVVYQAWILPNGSTSVQPILSLRFTQPGTQIIRLVVGTEQGCYDTAIRRLEVYPTPVVRGSGDFKICSGQTVRLSASGASTYSWTPQQGLSCTLCADPIASPDVSTTYTVRGTTGPGCSATDTVRITVIPRMRMTASGSDSICIGDSVRFFASGAALWEWSPATGLSATDVPSPMARPTVTTRYRVIGRDGQNCFTDTAYLLVAVGQPVRIDLGPDLTLPTGTPLPLKSTVVNGPIKLWEWSPSTNLSCTSCALPVATVRKNITYQVKVTSIYGCKATDSIRITAFCESAQVFIPNAFSPDGDGINDVLMVRAQGISSVRHFRIFNRWGEIVFERSNFTPNDPAFAWDGKVRGTAAWSDVFVYTAEVVCDDGTTYTYKGNITVIK